MSAPCKGGVPSVINIISPHGSRTLHPDNAQGEAGAGEETSVVARPCKKHAPSRTDEIAIFGMAAPTCGLPLVTFLNTQPWLRASLCGTTTQMALEVRTKEVGPAAPTGTRPDIPRCLACARPASTHVSQPCTNPIPATKEDNATHKRNDHFGNSGGVRVPVEASFVTITAPKSHLVFAHDPTVFLQPLPSTSNSTYDSRTVTSFPAVLAVVGNELRLSVGPECDAVEDVPEVELQKCRSHADRNFEQENRFSGAVRRSEGWNCMHWKYCFTFTRDAISGSPRFVVEDAITILEIPLPLLTLTLRVIIGTAAEDGARLTALATAILRVEAICFENSRMGKDYDDVVEGLNEKNCEADDKDHTTGKEMGLSSINGLSNALENLIQTGVALVIPPQPINAAMYGSSELLSRFAESAAATDRALTHAVRRARDWTQFALKQESSGSAGGVMTVEQFRERRIASRASYPSR